MPVGALAVYSLLHNVFFTVWKCVVWEYHGLAFRRVSCEKVSNLKYVTILQYKFAVECHNACWDIESPLLDKNSQLRLFLHNCNFISYIYHYYLTTSVNNFKKKVVIAKKSQMWEMKLQLWKIRSWLWVKMCNCNINSYVEPRFNHRKVHIIIPLGPALLKHAKIMFLWWSLLRSPHRPQMLHTDYDHYVE